MRSMLCLAALVAATAFSGAAFAADLPTHKAPAPPPPPVEPAFTWTGFYLGAYGGGNWSKTTVNDVSNPAFLGSPTLISHGGTFGGLAGYNFQFNSFILGAEGEVGYDRRSASANYAGVNGALRTESEYGGIVSRLRGRIGFGWNQFMIFAAGGGTLSDLQMTYTNPTVNPAFQQQIGLLRGGYNIGGGIEWAFAQHFIVRGEYIYDGYGYRTYNFPGLGGGGANAFDARAVKLQESTARAAIAYKF